MTAIGVRALGTGATAGVLDVARNFNPRLNLLLAISAGFLVVSATRPPTVLAALVLAPLGALEAMSHGADRVLLPLVVLAAIVLFPLVARAARALPPALEVALVALLLVALRLAVFGFTERRFSLEALDFNVTIAGQGTQHGALVPALRVIVRFALPFLPLFALASDALPAALRSRLLPLTGAILVARLAFLLVLYRFCLGQLVSYGLMPELFFTLCFLGSLVVAALASTLLGRAPAVTAPAEPQRPPLQRVLAH